MQNCRIKNKITKNPKKNLKISLNLFLIQIFVTCMIVKEERRMFVSFSESLK